MNAEAPITATVGRPARIESLVLPGTRLEPVADPDRTAAVAIRMVEVARHGTLLRYDLEVTGFEPGRHDLRRFLRRADGGSSDDLPEIPFEVVSVLEAGTPRVSVPQAVGVGELGGYRDLAIGAAAVWIAGLAAMLWLFRKKRAAASAAATVDATPADELSRLVSRARSGPLAAADHAAIERLVYDAWRRAIGLVDASPKQLVESLRRDASAAAALDRLAAWLHAPESQPPADVAGFVEEVLPPRRPHDAEAAR